MHVLQKKDIIFAERTGRSTTIVTTAEEVQTYQTLNDIKGDLPEKIFFVRIVPLLSTFIT